MMRKLIHKRVLIPVLAIFLLLGASGFKTDFFEIAKQIEIFTTLFKELNMNYVDETNPAELMDTAIKNMLDDLDPYTKFLNEQDVEAFRINNTGEYSGIGALVRSYEDRLLIIEPYKGYPADKAGLKAGDELITIAGIDVKDYQDDASELLKGANKTTVEVTYKRQGKTYEATIERDAIEVDAVPYFNMVDEETGYVVLSRFNKKASSQTKDAIESLKAEGAKKLILDLRGNPGGLLSEAINVTNLFVPKGTLVVTTKSKVKKFNQSYETRNKPLDEEIPLVVLVDGKSASASEIVSGSLQDLDRAVVIGARSFGKGLVQRPLKLTYGTQLKVTISRYYTPSGRCIQSLDYWNRDEEGNAVRNTQFNEFTTRNGRKVRDGGGVMPDIPIASLNTNDMVNALVNNNVLFDYATNFYYAHPEQQVGDFSLSDTDYEAFKRHVSSSSFDFQTKTELALKESLTGQNEEVFNQEVEENTKALLLSIEKSKIAALDTFRKEISKSLEDEIIKRYVYRQGLYDYYLSHDEAILASAQLLRDESKYRSILQ